jgi:hypothetical protein
MALDKGTNKVRGERAAAGTRTVTASTPHNSTVLQNMQRFLAGQQISYASRNPLVLRCVHSSQTLLLILSQMNPVHDFPHYTFNIRFNIILTSQRSVPRFLRPSGITVGTPEGL